MAIKKTDYLKFGEDLYEIVPPVPSETERGGIIASPKSDTDTVEVKLGDNGKLYVPEYPELNTDEIQTQIDEHVADTTVHITETERTNWNAAKTHADSAHVTGVKGNSESSYRAGQVNITKANIGLGNVDNTSDANKPVSTAQQTAIDTALDEAKDHSDTNLATAKSYTDTKTSSLASTSSVSTNISTHNTSTSAHSDIRTLISDLTTKLNNFLDVDDTTTDQLSEVLTLIDNNKGTLESLTTSKINVSDIVDNLTTSSTSKVLSAKQGVAIKTLIDALQSELDSHTHEIADVSGLQSALDEKASSSHGTHVSFTTTTPKMDGTAAIGTATTVSRSDHVHPTDTSRASQTDLDALETVVAGKANTSHNHAISDITDLQSTLDSKASSSHSHTITASASDDDVVVLTGTNGTNKVTYSASHANSGVTAGTYKSVTVDAKGHVTAGTNPTTLSGYGITDAYTKTQIDSTVSNLETSINEKAALSHKHAISDVTDLQTTLDSKTNQNAFSNITVGSTTVAADTTTDTVTFVGSNVTITPDATNDKITFAVADGSTSTKGIVKLTNSTSSTSTTTAATPSSVKSAYDLANTAKTNAATAQTTADSKIGSVSLASGTNNGTLKLTVDGTATDNIAVKGLGSAAYTASTAYATSGHNHDSAYDTKGAASDALESANIYTDQGLSTKAEKTQAVYYIEGSGTTDTTNKVATWTGTHEDISSYYNGLMIAYKVGTAGSTTTTLNINDLGAVTVVRNVSSSISTAFAVNSIVFLTYTTDSETPYWKVGDYDANTRNTVGDYRKNGTKLYFVGTTTSDSSATSSYATSYTNSNIYVNTNNVLYSANGFSGDLAGNADTATTATTLDGLTATVTELNILDGVIATATELNYLDGVSSNVQTQLDGKASSTHVLSKGTDTTATGSLEFGGTFTAVTDTTVSGHTITDKTTTYTLPSDRLFVTLVPSGTVIPKEANLNSTTYLKVGRYYCSSNANAATLTNTPLSTAFMMEVSSPLSTTIDNETTGTYVYRLRKITAYNTGVQYVQYCNSGATVGEWTYGNWYVMPRSLYAIDSTDTNGGSATYGSSTKPVYVNSSGTLTTCNTYAGGTAVTLNNSSKAGSTATIYAPTAGGTSGYFLTGAGATSAPTWKDPTTLSVGSATKATQDASGNTITSTYMTKANPTGTGSLSMNRLSGSTVGDYSVALGYNATASGFCSFAQGGELKISSMVVAAPIASGEYSYAQGVDTIASGQCSHAEGCSTTSSGNMSHAEGSNTTASGNYSHAEGAITTSSGGYSHAEGYHTTVTTDNTAVKNDDTILTSNTKYGYYSHAEGYYTIVSGAAAHAEGSSTLASGHNSHAEGCSTTASGWSSHAEGFNTTSLHNQHAQGHFNDTSTATTNSGGTGTTGTAFVIGNGTSSAASNACRITYAGAVIGKAAYASTGADYAEYFEWADANPENEERVGYFVTFEDGRFIRKANEGEYILGIVSGNPCVLGNHDECWMGQNEMDEWGRFIYVTETEVNEETGEEYEYQTYKVNPDYDRTAQYIPRSERPEWSAIGMLGVLSVRDDGTCKVNGYCKVADGGIATVSDTGYRVIERVTDNIIKIVFR